MEEATPEAATNDNRDSWGGWISNKVANAEAVLANALVGETPTRSHSLQNLREASRLARLAKEQRRPEQTDHNNEVLPPLTRRASGIDVTLSHAWGAVRRAAVAAMATFEEPARNSDTCTHHTSTPTRTRASVHPNSDFQTDSPASVGLVDATRASLASMTINAVTARDSAVSSSAPPRKDEQYHEQYHQSAKTHQSAAWDVEMQISDVTLGTSISCADFSQDKVICSSFADQADYPSSAEWESIQMSSDATSNIEERCKESNSDDASSSATGSQEVEQAHECEAKSEPGDCTGEDVCELLADFNIMFAQNGGAECVSRIKEIGETAVAEITTPVDLSEAVEAELKDVKLILDEMLQRLDSAVRVRVRDECSTNQDAFGAAEAVIEETNAADTCRKIERRNDTLLQDCSRLLAVFASKTCASVMESVEGSKEERTWSERVEEIACSSTLGISQLRVISQRFGVAICAGIDGMNGIDGTNGGCQGIEDFADRTSKVGDAGVEHVVECAALAIAALQVEAAQRAYQYCVKL